MLSIYNVTIIQDRQDSCLHYSSARHRKAGFVSVEEANLLMQLRVEVINMIFEVEFLINPYIKILVL